MILTAFLRKHEWQDKENIKQDLKYQLKTDKNPRRK